MFRGCFFVLFPLSCLIAKLYIGVGQKVNESSYLQLLCVKFSKVFSCCKSYLSFVMRKPAFCICENKDADQLCGNHEADQCLCFRYMDWKSLFYLNPKFQASSYLLWFYSLVCVGPGRKPRRPAFSQRGSFNP